MLTLDSCLDHIHSAAIAGHIRPDGDSVGSCLAVYNYILENYPAVSAEIYLDPIPEKFLFLKNADKQRDPASADPDLSVDLFLALDCGDLDRLGAACPIFLSARHTLCVDHHLTNEAFAEENVVDPSASSTAELLYHMMNREKITREIAECLYVGIALDTGIFRYPCTSGETMRIAGDLMATGIPFPQIVDEIYQIRTYPQQRIRGKAYLNSRLVLGGKCICSVITKSDMESCQATPEDLDEIVSELRSTSGVETAVFLYETDEGYKLSLRSASRVDVAAIAKVFGGGGHARAAGASMTGQPEEILDQLLPLIAAQI